MFETETVQERVIRQNAEAQASGYASYAAYLEGTRTAPWQLSAGQQTYQIDKPGVVGPLPGTTETLASRYLPMKNFETPGATVTATQAAALTGTALTLSSVPVVGTTLEAVLAGFSGIPVLGQLAVGVGSAYLAAQALGVQFPWETGPGEGIIAPWTKQVRDENGKWVTALTRPDLFGGVSAAEALGTIDGKQVVKNWKAGGWPFSMTRDGMIYTFNKSGVLKKWKPKKPIVLVRGSISLKNAIKAQRLLDKQWRVVAKRVKALKLA